MSLERDLWDLDETLMRNDDCVHHSDHITIFLLANDARELEQERDALKAENEKLRQLACDMWRDIPKTECSFDVEEGCCDSYEDCHGECALWYRMHELGIEVDDD